MIMGAAEKGPARRRARESSQAFEERFIAVILRCDPRLGRGEPRRATAASFEARATRGHLRMTVKIRRRQRDKNLAFAGAGDVREGQMTFAFLGLEIAGAEEAAEPAVSRPVGRIGEHLETVDRDQARAAEGVFFSFLFL